MKITKKILEKIIKEEIENLLGEKVTQQGLEDLMRKSVADQRQAFGDEFEKTMARWNEFGAPGDPYITSRTDGTIKAIIGAALSDPGNSGVATKRPNHPVNKANNIQQLIRLWLSNCANIRGKGENQPRKGSKWDAWDCNACAQKLRDKMNAHAKKASEKRLKTRRAKDDEKAQRLVRARSGMTSGTYQR